MKDEPDYNERHRVWSPSGDWVRKQAEAFDAEMERQKHLYATQPRSGVPKDLPQQLTQEEIAMLSESDFAIYAIAMREKKRRQKLQKREDPLDNREKAAAINRQSSDNAQYQICAPPSV